MLTQNVKKGGRIFPVGKMIINMFKIQKGYDTVSKTFRLPIELVERLDSLAYKYNLSLNQLVVQCLNYSLENLDESEYKEYTEKSDI